LEVIDLIGGGEWTRTTDLRIMRRSEAIDNKEDQQHMAEESGNVRKNPQTQRKQKID
jgi:hypothetical protein